MIAVSSFRPLGQDADWDRNQCAAKQSWDDVFESVLYLNEDEPKLDGPTTWFIGGHVHPTIKELCAVCAKANDWACIINADIVVRSSLSNALRCCNRKRAWAMVSYRWQKSRTGLLAVIDNGLDFFAALPFLWKMAYEECPDKLRLGHQTWDTWMLGFLNTKARDRFFDVTPFKCIEHPIHSGRRFVFDVNGAVQTKGGPYNMPRRIHGC